MDRVIGAVKATYNFFSGDAILLSAAIVAFVLGLLLARVAQASNALVAIVFIAIIVAGLIVTLAREIAGRPRQR
ncbi:MAG TPA: hypothetical protein VE338_14930 [Ktedonobacterales bacterium]|jgi:uncharacterized membrane protein|nr:hypothetical protein [Ktedonobacterales bacterium]